MTVTLTVYLATNQTTFTEMYPDVEAAADMVSHMADCLGAEIQAFDLSTFGHQGRLLRDRKTDLPITITEVIGSYDIEEN